MDGRHGQRGGGARACDQEKGYNSPSLWLLLRVAVACRRANLFPPPARSGNKAPEPFSGPFFRKLNDHRVVETMSFDGGIGCSEDHLSTPTRRNALRIPLRFGLDIAAPKVNPGEMAPRQRGRTSHRDTGASRDDGTSSPIQRRRHVSLNEEHSAGRARVPRPSTDDGRSARGKRFPGLEKRFSQGTQAARGTLSSEHSI